MAGTRKGQPKIVAREAKIPASGVRSPSARARPRSRVTSPTRFPGIAYRKSWLRGRTVHVVQADLNRPQVKVGVATAAGGIGFRDPWAHILRRTRPTAAMTGTYFDVATAIPIGTIMTGGVIVHHGSIGSSLAIRPDNQVEFAYHHPGRTAEWNGFETVLRAGPRLVVAGQVRLLPAWEGFRDASVYARKPRAAVGLTRRRKLLLVMVPGKVLLREMAVVMRDLGAVEAICMDGGSSAGLYYRGKTYQAPLRSLTNLLVIYENTAQYRRFAPRLVPGLPLSLSSGPGAA